MKILVDENIPAVCVKHLREMGHDVADVRGTSQEGSCDKRLWNKAQDEQRLLITTDKGFAYQRYLAHHGILIVRLRQPNRERITRRVIAAMQAFDPSEWAGLLVMMRDTVMSIWRVPGQ